MRWVNLLIWIFGCQAVGLIGARWTAPEIPAWYRGLRKPSFNPPNWVFGPVWTTLYLLMAIAAWRVQYSSSSPLREMALATFLVQLALNLLWTWIFFHRHAIRAALVEIALLWLAIAITTAFFARIDSIAAVLMLPYLLWVSFASHLNNAIARLN
ncbi:MAG: TspO/MBR family protein [Acidobacteriota bacterium]